MPAQAYDSEGRRYNQLVKSGNDDMRQDAVMQQFFQRVNVLLAAEPATRKRQLNIVTYKVRSRWWRRRSSTVNAALIVDLTMRRQIRGARDQARRKITAGPTA